MRKLLLTSTIALLGFASTAEAHFVLMSPAPTNPADTTGGKGAPPCGPDTSMTSMPTAVQGGHPMMLMLKETVPHDGFYRVALSIKSRAEIPVDNVVYDSKNKVLAPVATQAGTSDHADFEATPVFPVLADNLFLHVGTGMQTFMGPINIPNVTCDRCTLQVIEFMHPHGYNPGGGFFYHHCADLKITADPALPAFPPTGGDGGAPDSSPPKDASPEVSGTGGASTTGTAGAGGSTGGVGGGGSGASGAGGGSSGAAGAVASGNGGTSGTAGVSGTTGSAGAGAAGSTSGSAGSRSGGGGGCSLASPSTTDLLPISALIFFAAFISRRRRSLRAK